MREWGGTVYIYDVLSDKPTFHDYGRIDGKRDLTMCGLVMWDPVEGRKYGAILRGRHADRFGKPCRRCFRDASNQDDAPASRQEDA